MLIPCSGKDVLHLCGKWGGEGVVEGVRVRVGPHYSGVRPKGFPHKFHHIAEQNVIGSARIVCLCFMFAVMAQKTIENVVIRTY